MNGWSAKNVSSKPGQVVGASQTDTVVTVPYPITAGGALNCVVVLDVEDVAVTTGITAKLQTAVDGVWEDSKTAAIAADGRVVIRLNVQVIDDQEFLPLLNAGRVVITTGTSDTVTVSAVNVLQEL